MLSRFQTPGVPAWVTVFVSFMAIAGLAAGVVALVDPSVFFFTEADTALGQRWAGRMLGLGIVTGAAVVTRSRQLYVLVLLAGLARELGDLAGAVTDDEPIFLAIGTLIIGILAIDAIRRASADAEAALLTPGAGTNP